MQKMHLTSLALYAAEPIMYAGHNDGFTVQDPSRKLGMSTAGVSRIIAAKDKAR